MKNQITGKSLMFLYIFIHYKTAIIKAMLSFNWKDQQTVQMAHKQAAMNTGIQNVIKMAIPINEGMINASINNAEITEQ